MFVLTPAAIVQFNSGVFYGNQGDPMKALRHFEAAMQLDPSDPMPCASAACLIIDLPTTFAQCHCVHALSSHRDLLPKGKMYFERALAGMPHASQTWYSYSILLEKMGLYEESLAQVGGARGLTSIHRLDSIGAKSH